MPIYQTARLEEYAPRFLNVAQGIFDRVSRHVSHDQLEKHPGSFSIYAQTARDTAAKIIIYDPRIGRASAWPRMRDGVYVWIRANGVTGEAIWDGVLRAELPWVFDRMWRDETVQIAANNQADFTHFPVMAGDDLEEIALLLAGCSRV